MRMTRGEFIYDLTRRSFFYSGGCDKQVYRFDANGNELNHWHMDPLEKSIKGVNPPFVYCMERSEHDGSVFCGCGDGSIRQLLSTEKGDEAKVISVNHDYSISGVGLAPMSEW